MNFIKFKRQVVLAAVGAMGVIGLVLAPAAHALQQVTTGLPEPMNLQATVSTFDCENSPGPWINFEGTVTLGELNVQLIFRNNINRDVHTYVEDIQTVVGVATGTSIRIPKQPSHPFEGGTGTGVGGNPWISIQIVDSNGNPLSGEVLLGRCVQGAFNSSIDFSAPVIAQAIISATLLVAALDDAEHIVGIALPPVAGRSPPPGGRGSPPATSQRRAPNPGSRFLS